jgi:hypothetical protein
VPLVVGGIVGGQLGGLVAAAILIPWFGHLMRVSEHARASQISTVGREPDRMISLSKIPRIERREDQHDHV